MAAGAKARSARRLGAVLVVAIPLALLLAAHSAGAAGPTVSANPTTVAQGAATTVSWSGIASPTPTDWVGLFASSGAANTAFVTWRYTTGTAAGSVPLTIPVGTPAGSTYELRLFANDGFTRLATSGPITIPAPAISANPTTVAQGATTTVSWSGIPSPTPKDWIGLYGSPGA